MNTEIIRRAAHAALHGTSTFPEVVKDLLAAGVEYCHMNYVSLRKTFYSADGDTVTNPINYEGLPPVAAEFDAAVVRADILDSQQNGQHYRDFTVRAMKAGVRAYYAFLLASASPALAVRAISTSSGSPVPGRTALRNRDPVPTLPAGTGAFDP